MLLRSVTRRVVGSCTTSLQPCGTTTPWATRMHRHMYSHNKLILNGMRLYCTDKKKPDSNESSGVESLNNSVESLINNTNSTQNPITAHDKTSTEKREERTGAGEGEQANTDKLGSDKTSTGEGEKTGEKNNTSGAGEEAGQGQQQEQGQGQGQGHEEPLPPWWGSLPLWKKLLYPSLAISIVSFITELVYASTLRTTLPYKHAMHVIRNVDEIEEAFGEIKEPKWYRFWEVLYGYWWVQASGYEGVSKLWMPIVGVKEYKTDQVDKNGEPVMKQTFTRGRAYLEAKKEGAGETEWVLTYLVVKGEKLGDTIGRRDEELLDVNDEDLPKPIKGQMVLVDRHVQIP